MRIKILNKNDVLDFKENQIGVKIDDVKINFQPVQNIFTDYTHIQGTGLIQSDRKINITIHFSEENPIDFRNYVNYLYNFFYKDNEPFYYQDLNNQIQCEVVLTEIKNLLKQGTEFYHTSLNLAFIMKDLFFEDIHFTVINENFTNVNSHIVNINNIKSNIVYPIIILNFDQSITNLYIQGKKEFLNMNMSNYGAGNNLIIDSKNGIIEIDKGLIKVNAINNLVDGGFVLFYNGNNTLNFYWNLPATGSIQIKYKERYLI